MHIMNRSLFKVLHFYLQLLLIQDGSVQLNCQETMSKNSNEYQHHKMTVQSLMHTIL